MAWFRENLDTAKAPLFLARVWCAWKASNKACIAQENISKYQLVRDVSLLANHIALGFGSSRRQPRPPRWVTWHPSREDVAVLNVDGSCIGNPGRAGFSGLLRTTEGEWMIGFYGFLVIGDNLQVA